MLQSTETYRVEKTISTTNMDKFCEAICAFANDLPDSRKKGYLFIGVNDDGTLSGLKVDDGLLKKIAAIRSDGNILPLPTMSVERFEFPDGDLLVAEVSPSLIPPVRYRGRAFVRIGPRRDIATEVEERILTERRTSFMATFDATPCIDATLADLELETISNDYLPTVVDPEILSTDKRDIKDVFDVSKLTVFCVTIHSNVEFVSETQTITHDGTQGVPQDVPQDVPQAIMDLVSNNPKITREEIAKQLGISSKTVGRHLKKLSNCVRYIGKGYSGHWEVLEKTNDKL